MNLDNLINKNVEFRIKRKAKAPTKKISTEKRIMYSARNAIRLITTGDYDSKNPRHRQCLCYARRLGWVDRNSLTILKEE